MSELLATLPRPGRLEWIGLRTARRAPVVGVPEVEVRLGLGLVGDHGRTEVPRLRALTTLPGDPFEVEAHGAGVNVGGQGKRQVTLIQAEHLPVIAALAGLDEVTPGQLRRNLVVSGINVLAFKESRFRVGGVLLEGTGGCHPCSRMEENLGEGGYNAVRGHGGITARVLQGGTIRVGDLVVPDQAVRPA